jgi:hypothetical protein
MRGWLTKRKIVAYYNYEHRRYRKQQGFFQAINGGIPEERRAVVYEGLRLFAQAVRIAALHRCR